MKDYDQWIIQDLIAATEYFHKLAKNMRKSKADYMTSVRPGIMVTYVKVDINKVNDILAKHKAGQKIKIIKYRYLNGVEKMGEIRSLRAAKEYQDYLKFILDLYEKMYIEYNKYVNELNELIDYYASKYEELKAVLESKFFNSKKMNRIKELYQITNKEKIFEIITSDKFEYKKVKELCDVFKKEDPSMGLGDIFIQVGEKLRKDPENVRQQYYQTLRSNKKR